MSKKIYFMDLECLCDEKGADKNSITAVSIVDLEGTVERTVTLRPSTNFKVSSYCTELTGFTYEQLAQSPTLKNVYSELFEGIYDEDHIIYAWGKDGQILSNVLLLKNIDINLNIENFQKIVRDYCNLALRPGLDMTMTMLQGRHNYKNHSVLDDTLMLREIYKAFNSDKELFKRDIRLMEFNKRIQDLYNEYKDVIE